MKHERFIIAGILVLIGVFTFSQAAITVSATCHTPYRHDAVVRVGRKILIAEAAKTEVQQVKGLGGRGCIDANEAMLFVFNKPDYYSFWMKDMKFPIDMVWIGSNHKTVTVQANVAPSTYPESFISTAPAQYVLELKAGEAQVLNISNGTPINF